VVPDNGFNLDHRGTFVSAKERRARTDPGRLFCCQGEQSVCRTVSGNIFRCFSMFFDYRLPPFTSPAQALCGRC
jgi:hypothetical protein